LGAIGTSSQLGSREGYLCVCRNIGNSLLIVADFDSRQLPVN